MGDKHATERLDAGAEGIARAAALLESGALVALPTETVYGLAGRADRVETVAAIYRAKGRPDFNPLIVHVPDLAAAERIARFDDRARMLADRFWPGPLTLVLPMEGGAPVAAAVTTGLPTVALRCPAHPVMQEVLAAAGVPLAAPSANRSGAVSPTTAGHVLASLDGRIDAVLDGGPCEAGVESTIVAPRAAGWQLLREGPIAREVLVDLLGEPLPISAKRIEAPGQLAQHYSPGKPVRLEARSAGADEFMIGFGGVPGDCSLSPTGDLAEAAARLYECLHLAAASSKAGVAVAPVPDTGIGRAINDRLRRAAA
ncbi:Threonylcarbamoyl-AMP synthase [Tsuneonella dongtanensis]|uniref:Threonylcarbamoyl-AMP synthase n=1 Tax=Tsuneonella dongtanensis TaxID=692370 RepID=A0A1B2AA21_9SPHN|nr:L-threonylcarbamoyladenylate synthase [Tsuneonella dongtanensis]ANY18996.1 Threonylcarbamoyl-AMP synthase [Tsuneonella dongtanensis]